MLSSFVRAVRALRHYGESSEERKPWPSVQRLRTTVKENWYLGFTSFGGPPVHFRILREKFVSKLQWVDEQMYQELFGVAQALPGPGSTKMLYCINVIHDSSLSGIVAFLLWSLPGALAMYGLSIGISNVSETLPRPVYALLSGLNAATVGVIALAGVQLAETAITDKVTRVLVFLGGTAGILYNALWYFPTLMTVAGCVTLCWDFRWLHRPVNKLLRAIKRRQTTSERREIETRSMDGDHLNNMSDLPGSLHVRPPSEITSPSRSAVRVDTIREVSASSSGGIDNAMESQPPDSSVRHETVDVNETVEERVLPVDRAINISWQFGVCVIVTFLLTFITIMVLRTVLNHRPLLFSLFANLYLAGTIIFGGGPVVIPLLREYVVAEGWVSPRDFLLGLAIIQAFPGPNFNFAVYLGSLAALHGGKPSFAGAIIGFIGIFGPGLILVHGTMGLWRKLRSLRSVKSVLRGVNAAAVGLIYAAVYRLWQIGYIDVEFSNGTSLSREPWWVVVAATSYSGVNWFGMKVPFSILLGGLMGLIWYSVAVAAN